jgi:hypothetical protein
MIPLVAKVKVMITMSTKMIKAEFFRGTVATLIGGINVLCKRYGALEDGNKGL